MSETNDIVATKLSRSEQDSVAYKIKRFSEAALTLRAQGGCPRGRTHPSSMAEVAMCRALTAAVCAIAYARGV